MVNGGGRVGTNAKQEASAQHPPHAHAFWMRPPSPQPSGLVSVTAPPGCSCSPGLLLGQRETQALLLGTVALPPRAEGWTRVSVLHSPWGGGWGSTWAFPKKASRVLHPGLTCWQMPLADVGKIGIASQDQKWFVSLQLKYLSKNL